jgi:hypothetical protein
MSTECVSVILWIAGETVVCPIHKLIGFHNRQQECLLRGTSRTLNCNSCYF